MQSHLRGMRPASVLSPKLRAAIILGLAICAIVAGLVLAIKSSAASPTMGVITPTSGPLTYTAGPFVVANPTAQASGLKPIDVRGIGSEAFCVKSGRAGTLFVRSNEKIIRLSLRGSEDETVKLEKSKTLAKQVLSHLK